MDVIYKKNVFTQAKNITWNDIIEKIADEYTHKTCKTIHKGIYNSPTVVCHSQVFKDNLLFAYNEVNSLGTYNTLHIYISFGENADTFNRHNDNDDVLLVQAIGNMTYLFDDGKKYELSPGDTLFIPKQIYHTPIVKGKRVTLSFSK